MCPASVAIAGGGPAGSALAIHLAQLGCTVTVIAPERARVRPAETLPLAVNALLAELGLPDLLTTLPHVPCSTIAAAWGSEEPVALPAPGFHVDRDAFDARLLLYARALGVTVIGGAVIGLRHTGVWNLALDGGRQHEADIFVDASGRNGRVAQVLGARRHAFDRLTAIVWRARQREADSALRLASACSGYSYTTPLPDGGVSVVCVTDADLVRGRLRDPPGLDAQLLAPALAARVERLRYVACVSARTSLLDRAAGRGWLAVGDAAQALDPLSGHGVLGALEGARAAAHAIRTGNLMRYTREQGRRFERELAARAKSYGAERRFGNERFWQRRHLAGAAADTMPVTSFGVSDDRSP